MTDLKSWMDGVKSRVDSRLERYFGEKLEEASNISPDSVELVEGVQSLTLRGGKRFRPMMVEAAYGAVSPGTTENAVDAGASLEVLQSYLLIHDDWMDQDDERRGGPAVHAMYRNRYDSHMADSLAILCGDLACAYSLELLMHAPFAPEQLPKGLQIFLQLQKEVFFGQHLDITANPNVAKMHDLKTTSYTVRGPLLLGASLAGASDEQNAVLTAYANPLGEAFQLADDLLGTFGDMATTGKPGNDVKNRKRTSLVGEAERLLAPGTRDALDRVMAGEDKEGDVDAAIALLVSSGAKANVENRLLQRADESKAALQGAPLDSAGIEILACLADRLALRAV
ncbi:MAG: geranylgeranyl diphosphate synthase type I [Polyangiales bacterium]|jgi:geranylgeranyl diphosphate synthase type I